jgi:predicted Zn-dependent peptidase
MAYEWSLVPTIRYRWFPLPFITTSDPRNEKEGRTGFAHLFEHMMFQGSENVAKAAHFQHIFNAGGTMNGTTSTERTNYFETLPSNYLPLAFWLESDRMRSLKVTQENLDNQRNAVQEEKRLRYDNQPYVNAFPADE